MPAGADTSAADACKRDAQGEITKSDIAISEALAAQKLELFAPQFLPTPFDEAPRGAAPDPAEDKRRAEARAPFAGKHTGDVVTWLNAGQAVTGIYIEPAKEGWLVARKGNQIVAAKPATCASSRAQAAARSRTQPAPVRAPSRHHVRRHARASRRARHAPSHRRSLPDLDQLA